MDPLEILSAVGLEVRSTLRPGWRVTRSGSALVIDGPNDPDFVGEVWRIARFVAYDEFVSISRLPADGRNYRVVSRAGAELAFELLIRAEAE